MRIRRSVDLSNPAVVFAAVWAVTLLLLQAQLMYHLTPLSARTIAMVVGNIVSFFAFYVVLRLATSEPRRVDLSRLTTGVRGIRRTVWIFVALWLVGSVAEFVAARGVPLLWLLEGVTDRDYRDFGLATFHGFMNSLYLFSLSALCLDVCLTGSRRRLVIIAILLLWPVIIISRGLLVWALAQMAGIYVLVKRVRWVSLATLALAGLLFVLAFGIFGDFRVGALGGGISPPVARSIEPLSRLPSGFAWTYGYVTSALNNVNAAIDTLEPSYRVYYSTINLFPTVLRRRIYPEDEGRYPLPLVDESYNTSTVYGNFVADFGPLGAATILSVIQIMIVAVYLTARRGTLWAALACAILFQGILLSIVTDTFTSLVNVAQLGLAGYIRLAHSRVSPAPARQTLRQVAPT